MQMLPDNKEEGLKIPPPVGSKIISDVWCDKTKAWVDKTFVVYYHYISNDGGLWLFVKRKTDDNHLSTYARIKWKI
jgi:hypothetical protein